MGKQMNIPQLRFSEFKGEWVKKKLGEVAEIARGKSKHRPRDAEFLYGGKYPFIQTGDIRNAGLYLESFTQTYSTEGLKQSKLWNENTLCITIAANIAETTILKIKACFPDSVIGFVPKNNKTIVLFAKYQFDKFKIDVQRLSQGMAQANLNQESLSKIAFSFPSLLEQTKISSFLSAVDEKLQSLKKKRSLLEDYKKGAMQKLFSKQLRFKDEDGKSFPKWEFKNGNLIFETVTNKDHNSDLPILAITQEHGAIPRNLIDYNISVTDKSIESYKVVEVGDFIISLRSFQGGIEYSNYKGICSLAYIILRPYIDIDRNFFKYFFKTTDYIKTLNKTLEGIRDGKMISYKNFSEVKLPFPSKKEQTKIVQFFSSIDEKINYTQTQIEKTETWKKGLLQKMFV